MTRAVLALSDGIVAQSNQSGMALAFHLAHESGLAVHVASIGGPPRDYHGCARAWQIDASDARAASGALTELLEQNAYAAIVADDTAAGREVLGRLSGRLGLPLAARVLSARLEDQWLEVVRTVENGKRSARYRLACLPALALVDAEASPPVAPRPPDTPELVTIRREGQGQVRMLSERILDSSELALNAAEVVVAGGRGLGGPEGFRLLEELARLLHGCVGASRVAVDLGWAPRSAQIGMTGKTVSPRLYIACGISGAVHHTFGMKDSGFVVAINKDPGAPIFKFADVGIVGDIQEVLTELTTLLRSRFPRDEAREALVGASP